MTRSAMTRMPRWCACSTKRLEVLDGAVVGVDREEVGDVVAAVAERRLVHRQEPDAVDAEPLEVVELLDQPAEVAGAVVVPVEEPADVDLVEDRGLEPERVRARTSGPGSDIVARRRQRDSAVDGCHVAVTGQPPVMPRQRMRLELEDVGLPGSRRTKLRPIVQR